MQYMADINAQSMKRMSVGWLDQVFQALGTLSGDCGVLYANVSLRVAPRTTRGFPHHRPWRSLVLPDLA